MAVNVRKLAKRICRLCYPGLAVAVCIAAAPVNASLMDVSKIEVTSTNNTWIQIAELIATETRTGTNAALTGNGGPAFAPNVASGRMAGSGHI